MGNQFTLRNPRKTCALTAVFRTLREVTHKKVSSDEPVRTFSKKF